MCFFQVVHVYRITNDLGDGMYQNPAGKTTLKQRLFRRPAQTLKYIEK